MPPLRNASKVRFFASPCDTEGRGAFVVVTRPPGHGLDLMVPWETNARTFALVGPVLHRDRPERAPGSPCWLPID